MHTKACVGVNEMTEEDYGKRVRLTGLGLVNGLGGSHVYGLYLYILFFSPLFFPLFLLIVLLKFVERSLSKASEDLFTSRGQQGCHPDIMQHLAQTTVAEQQPPAEEYSMYSYRYIKDEEEKSFFPIML